MSQSQNEPQNIGTDGQSFLGYAALAEETAFGESTEPEVFVDATSASFSGENNVQYPSTIRGRGRYKARGGAYGDEGEIELPAGPENGMGLLLKAAFGEAEVSTNTDDTVGTHTFTPGDFLPSLSVELGVGGVGAVRHTGAGVSSFELEHSAEEYLTATAEMPAKQPIVQDTRAAPAFSNLHPFMYHDVAFEIDGTDLTVDLQEATFALENNVEAMYRGERTASKMDIGAREPSVEATVDLENMDLWKKFLGAADATEPGGLLWEGSLSATYTSPETIADTGEHYALTIEMPRVVAESHEAEMSENEQIGEALTFGALEDVEGGQPDISATLVNSKTTVY